MYSIPKLCTQNNLPNTTKGENKYFFYQITLKFHIYTLPHFMSNQKKAIESLLSRKRKI